MIPGLLEGGGEGWRFLKRTSDGTFPPLILAHVESAGSLKGIPGWGHLCCLFLQPYAQPAPFYSAAYGTATIEYFTLIDLTWIILLAAAQLIQTEVGSENTLQSVEEP